MKKIFAIVALIIMLSPTVQAKSLKSAINKLIEKSNIPQSSISISVKSLQNDKVVYSLNDKMMMHPASVQKMMTIVPIAEVLGEEYELSTSIYSRGKDGYVIKLGADPYFTSGDLRSLVNNIDKTTVKKIYIDDSIIERKDWGEGWQWDDDLNTSTPRFNSYNLDRNLIRITVMPTEPGQKATIINPSKYPIAFYNNVITGKETSVHVSRENAVALNAITLDGTVSEPKIITIPNNNLKRYFDVKLTNTLADRSIYLKEPYRITKIQETDKEIGTINHSVQKAISDILQNSNNMSIESLSKIAAAKKYNKIGTDTDGIKLFEEYCESIGMDSSLIRIVDASGVSKNNLLNSDFVSEYLVKNQDKPVYEMLPTPGKGTLNNRMIPLKDNLKAKTGTLSDISSIAGFITSKKGERFAFCIIINDPNSKSVQKKLLEDYIIKDLYLNL